MIGKLKVLFQIALRNLFASPMNIIIGLIMLGGVFFIVFFGSIIESIDDAMTRSMVGSVAGHIQVYSGKSKEALSLFGGMMGDDSDVAVFDDYATLEKTLLSVPNVDKVVPMGVGGALISSGNTVDLTLAKLRETVKAQRAEDSPALREQIESQKDHVRQMLSVLRKEREAARELVQDEVSEPEVERAIAKASSDEFWARFDEAPFDALEFLENKIAPLVTDADILGIRYVGTDFERFREAFPAMEIVEGAHVPRGRRGILIPEFFYEEFLKLKSARRLDKLKEGLAQGKRIETDPVLQRYVKENQTQIREIIFQLDRLKTEALVKTLQKATGSEEASLQALLPRFFATTDQNLQERYDLFYAEVAPLLELYRIRVGDTFTIKAFTKTGYVQSVNVKVHGTFRFKELEKSPLAGMLSVMDLVSFRELYGHLTAEKAAELARLQEASGVEDISREDAEAELFGGDARTVVAEATTRIIDEDLELGGGTKTQAREDRGFRQDELDHGVVLNAAIILEDPSRLRQTISDIEAAGKRDGLSLRAISWTEASGMFGQLVTFSKLGLYAAVAIMFIVALVVISNAMLMATLQRVSQIGTVRAIGAQRTFVLAMVLVETVVIGAVFGVAGMLLGAAAVRLWLGSVGIPAFTEELYFFFAGPRLFPTVDAGTLFTAFVVILITSVVSTLYPAMLATRVSPLRAMQSDE